MNSPTITDSDRKCAEEICETIHGDNEFPNNGHDAESVSEIISRHRQPDRAEILNLRQYLEIEVNKSNQLTRERDHAAAQLCVSGERLAQLARDFSNVSETLRHREEVMRMALEAINQSTQDENGCLSCGLVDRAFMIKGHKPDCKRQSAVKAIRECLK